MAIHHATSLDCSECGMITENIEAFKDHSDKHHSGAERKSCHKCDMCENILERTQELDNHKKESHNSEEENKYEAENSEYNVIKPYPENNKTEEDELLNKIVGVSKKEVQQEGITMKGKNIAFKDACIAVKSKLTKGKVIKDDKGRQINILNEKGDGSLEVEVQTLSKRSNKKRGLARLHM